MIKRRASIRTLKKTLKAHASTLPAQKRKRAEKMINAANENVWPTVQYMYNIGTGNVSARNKVSRAFYPVHRKYNASKNNIVTKNNANRFIRRSIAHKNIGNILMPLTGGVARGGVHTGYVAHAIKNANIKYAIINKANGKLKAFALIKNKPNSRYINVIAGFHSYGHPMMNRILANAKSAGKKQVNLKAVTHVTNNKQANNDPLVKWYHAKGFRRSGVLNNGQLLPMSLVFS